MIHDLLVGLLVLASLGLVIVVLLQSGRSAGLSGAIAGGAETLFGKKKGMDALLGKMTAGFAVAFMVLAVLVAVIRN